MKSPLFLTLLLVLAMSANAQPWLQAPYLTINGQSDSSKLRNFYEIQKAFNLYEKDQEKLIAAKEERERKEKANKSPIAVISRLFTGRKEREKERNERHETGKVASIDDLKAANAKNGAKENQAEDEEENEGKFPGYAQFKRWENNMAPRVYPSGDISLPSTNHQEFQKYKANTQPKRAMRPGHTADLPMTSCTFSGNWTPIGPTGPYSSGSRYSGVGRLNFISLDPSNVTHMFSGGLGGLWTSTNSGASWTTNTDTIAEIAFSDIAVDPNNSNIIYAATGDANGTSSQLAVATNGIIKSTNGGVTWSATGLNWTPNLLRNIYKILIRPDSTNIILAATSIGIYRTTNSGTSWTFIQSGLFTDIQLNPANPQTVYAVSSISTNGKFYKSNNGGRTFTNITSGYAPTASIGRQAIGVTPADTNFVYVVTVNASSGFYGMYLSKDAGNTFTLKSTTPDILSGGSGSQAWYDLAIAVSPVNKGKVVVGGMNLYISTDTGVTWSANQSTISTSLNFIHPDIHAIKFLPGNDTTYYCANDGGIWKTTNSGTTWTDVSIGLQNAQLYNFGVSAQDPNFIIAGFQDQGFHQYRDTGWSLWGMFGDGMKTVIDYSNDSIMYFSVNNGRVYKTVNQGAGYSFAANLGGSGVNATSNWQTPFIMNPVNHNTVLIGKAQVYRSYNQASSWAQVGSVSGGTGNICALAYAKSDTNYMYAAKSNKLFVCSNGSVFTDRTGTLPVSLASITSIGVSQSNPRRLWVTFSGYNDTVKVYTSIDSGLTWSNCSTGLPNLPVNCILNQAGSYEGVYVGTDVGIYYRDNLSTSWRPFFTDLPNVDVEEMKIEYGIHKIRAATNGRGLWVSDMVSYPDTGVIAGTTTVCVGSNVTLSDTVGGGRWVSSNTSIATIGSSSGIVTGVTAGSTVISYLVSNTCTTGIVTATLTVIGVPSVSAITGAAIACVGASSLLFDVTVGGTWSCSNTAVATVGSTGSVFGVSAGPALISYTVSNSCGSATASQTVTINPLPSAGSISGSSSVCIGASTSYTDGVGSGSWSSSNTANATVGTTGSVTGLAAGTSIISYLVTNTCGSAVATHLIAVISTPDAGSISGSSSVCISTSTLFTDAVVGGVWSSSNTAVASVGTTGLVSGVSSGSALISYTVSNSCGNTTVTHIVSVIISPDAGSISGSSTVCAGSSTSLSDAVGGGSWSSSNTAVATIGSTGSAFGIASGTSVISYMVSSTCGSSVTTMVLLVNPLPSAGSISGSSSVCIGASTSYTDGIGSGNWSSSNTAIASVGTTGSVTGVASGTSIISYLVTNICGAAVATHLIAVISTPDAGSISGSSSVCISTSTLYTDAAPGGVWSSSNTAVASVGTTGLVSGFSAGSALISYTVSNSCGNTTVTRIVSVITSPDAGSISGTSTVCAGSSTSLSDTVGGGSWSSNNTAVATIGSTGSALGIASGTSVISYMVSSTCGSSVATMVLLVNPLPSAGSITGTSSVCVGAAITLSDAAGSGTWISSNTAIASVGSTGIVSGVSSGTLIITYIVVNSCGSASATRLITVIPLPVSGSISGAASVCQGASTLYADTTPGGVWSSSNTAVASIGTSGMVAGVSIGSSIISYLVSNTCGYSLATAVVVVNPLPSAGSISGASSICAGTLTSWTDAASGGIWSSSNTVVATVGTSGVIGGVSAGTSRISYTVTNGCGSAAATSVITVNPLPNAGTISGGSSVGLGGTLMLTDGVAGGTWGVTNGNASISGGMVTGLSLGIDTVTYLVSNSCGTATATKTIIVVNTLPGITGANHICTGSSTTLSDTGSGTWSSSNSAVASIGMSTGIVTGISTGVATITYTGLAGYTTMSMTVNPTPGSISGGAVAICEGNTTIFGEVTPGGSWSSSNSAVATVDTSGTVHGMLAGTAIISYTLPTGCYSIVTITINAAPGVITGPGSVCAGQTIGLSNSVAGGGWSSSSPSVATVGSTGVVTGISGSLSAIISYTLSDGCRSTKTVSVNSLSAISGPSSVCQGQIINLTDATAGGVWSSPDATLIIGSSSGAVTGLSGGTATISYILGSGCIATTVIMVNAIAAITGPNMVCVGQSISLSNVTPGGAWSTATPTIATVGSTGIVNGVAGGLTAIISYTPGTGCRATFVVTVNALSPITGHVAVCPGLTITVADATPGGRWISSAPALASIGSASGIITGVAAGSSVISYLLPTGCLAQVVVNVGAMAPITGPSTVCVGQAITLSDITPGGTWSSSAPTIATVGTSGTVTGVAGGLTANITYSIGTTCRAVKTVSVNALTATSIPGTVPLCAGTTVNASNTTGGGIWSSGNTAIAMVGSTGIILGVSAGSVVISYSLPSGCVALITVTVNPLSPITGMGNVCLWQTLTLSDATPGGVWTSTGTSATIATIGSSSGIVTGIAANLNAMITYTMGSGCKAYTTVSVMPLPVVSAITGPSTVSVSGGGIMLTDATAGGIWVSSNTARATVGSTTGAVIGVSSGVVTISYCVTNAAGCVGVATKNVNVGPMPPQQNNGLGSPFELDVNIALTPNPNKGEFTIAGELRSGNDEDLSLEVTDMVGKVHYRNSIMAKEGKVNAKITLNGQLSSGMYILRLHSATESQIFYFVINR